jgi:hypothetical protein
VIGPYPDKRRACVIAILTELRKHAHTADFTVEDVETAFAEDDRLQSELKGKDAPERSDLLVLTTILRLVKMLPGIFLTTDERLRELAIEHQLPSPDPEEFANGM